MDIYAELTKAIDDAHKIKELSGTSGEFFAMLLVADLNSLEKRILDGLARYEEMKKSNTDMPEINVQHVGDKAALIGCLMRFRDDLAENTDVGRKCKKKYDEMIADGTL